MTEAEPRQRAAFLGLASIVGLIAIFYGYARLFGQFPPYDDEGTMLLSIIGVLDGRGLFDEVLLPYGPGYYLAYSAIFSALEPSTDNARLLTFVSGIGLIAASTWIAWGITRSRLLGVAATTVSAVVAFAALAPEPLHPVSLTMITSVGIIGTALIPGRLGPVPRGLIAGFLLALMILTKINIGTYLLIAMLFSVLALADFPRRRWIVGLVGAAIVILPWLIAGRNILTVGRDAAFPMALVASLGLLALVVAGAGLGRRIRVIGRQWATRWGVAALASAVLSGILMVGSFLVVFGDDPVGLFSGLVTVPATIGSGAFSPLDFPFGMVPLAAVLTCFSVFLSFSDPMQGPLASRSFQATVRIGAGVVVLASLAAISTGAYWTILFPIVVSWVVLIPHGSQPVTRTEALARLLAPSIAVLGALGIFPVAVSQVSAAALSFLPLALLLVSDGLVILNNSADRPGLRSQKVFPEGVTQVAVLAAVFSFFVAVAIPVIVNFARGGGVAPTGVAEASRLRLAATDAEGLGGLVDAVRESRCSSLMMLPAKNSVLVWSGLAKDSPMALGVWPFVYSQEDQDRIVREAQRGPRPCLLRARQFLEEPGWVCSGEVPQSPRIVDYFCSNDFAGIRRVGEWAEGSPWELLVDYSPSRP